jgi:hypothetical protein
MVQLGKMASRDKKEMLVKRVKMALRVILVFLG